MKRILFILSILLTFGLQSFTSINPGFETWRTLTVTQNGTTIFSGNPANFPDPWTPPTTDFYVFGGEAGVVTGGDFKDDQSYSVSDINGILEYQ